MLIKCEKCKQGVTSGTSIKLKKGDSVHKMVCYPCYDKIMKYRAARGYDEFYREVKKD